MLLRPKAADRTLKILRREKNGKLDNKVISPKRSKNFCIADQFLKRSIHKCLIIALLNLKIMSVYRKEASYTDIGQLPLYLPYSGIPSFILR